MRGSQLHKRARPAFVNTAGSSLRTRAWQASDRWNRSSQPMQCIGKTPVDKMEKTWQQKHTRTPREYEAYQRGLRHAKACCSAMG
jgi:hypothetical protein